MHKHIQLMVSAWLIQLRQRQQTFHRLQICFVTLFLRDRLLTRHALKGFATDVEAGRPQLRSIAHNLF
jgi:hypothetical protein